MDLNELARKIVQLKIFLTIIVILQATLIVIPTAKAQKLSENEALTLIQKNIESNYMLLPKKIEVRASIDNEIKDFVKMSEKSGIVKTTLIGGLGIGNKKRSINNANMFDVFKIELTEKAKKIPHFTTQDNKIAFSLLQRRIKKIILIEKVDEYNFVIFFTFIQIPYKPYKSLFGINAKERKFKGQVEIIYDIFTKQYIMNSFLFSSWENLEWKKSTWVLMENDKQIIRISK